MRKFILFLIVNVLILNGFVASGQIVNIENQRLRKLKEGWSGNLDLSFSLTSNTRMILQLGNRNIVHWKKENHLITGITDFSFVAVDQQNYVNNGFQHLRYAYNSKQFPKIFIEGFEQLQYNQIQLIKFRGLLGGGARAIILDHDSASVNFGAFVMGEYEEESNDRINRHLRYSTFLSLDFQFNKTTGLNPITYYQPDFVDPSDYRISSETSLRFSITQKLKFKLVYNIQYDTNPPLTAPKTIYYIQNAFSFEF